MPPLLGEKRVEVRVARACSTPFVLRAAAAEWYAVACLIEPGRRPFEVVATGVSKGIPDEDVAIRLALLNLSEKVSWQEQELVAQALTQPIRVVTDRLFIPKGALPQRVSDVVAILRGNLST